MEKQQRLKQLNRYLDGKLLKLGITLGATKTVEATVNTFIQQTNVKILAWLLFLAAIITGWVFQDRLEDAKEKAVDG